MACRRASARSRRIRNGSRSGARSTGEGDAPKTALELEVLVRGVFERRRFLDLLQHFIVFEEDPDSGALHKIIAGYHQFHAVNAAVEETVRASGMDAETARVQEDGGYWAGRMHGGKPGDRRAGVVWHTQGSGKSFSMLFYAARIVRHPAMQNPTLVVLTDRNDLDDQLFGQFQRARTSSARRRCRRRTGSSLRELLAVASGGVVFTTIQKFLPEKGREDARAERAAEHHRDRRRSAPQPIRSLIDGARPASCATRCRMRPSSASPARRSKRRTRTRGRSSAITSAIYDIQRAVADKATVPIYYESRIAKLGLNAAELPKIDEEFEEITEGEELTQQGEAQDEVGRAGGAGRRSETHRAHRRRSGEHFEKRLEAMDGKAMIVCMSRRICVDLYNALIALRPEWASAPGRRRRS